MSIMSVSKSILLAPSDDRVRPRRRIVAPIVASPDPQRDPAPTEPGWFKGGNIPSLDGLRAISISIVLLAHASLMWRDPSATAGWSLGWAGGIGVDLFFVISGFLITWLLLRERRRRGTISLRAFYVRRAWRILPAYLVFLGSLVVMSSFGLVQLTARDCAGALTYTVNFLPGASWPIGHLWSLSVEEHFYLFWPLLLVVLGPGRACALAGGYFVLAPLVRLLIWALAAEILDIDYCTPARIDTIAAGCLLAYLADNANARRLLTLPSRHWAAATGVLAVAGLVVSNTVLTGSGLYVITIHRTFDALCFAGLVWAGISRTDGLLAWLLNVSPMIWLGRLSYGLYLWQQPFLNPHQEYWAGYWPVCLALVLVFALVSFALVERPTLRLRESRSWGQV
jgi:peptidoglycan/LPS O-acetylase OafA/YrhL